MTTMLSPYSPDSQKISLKVIEAVKQHPVLYISEVKGNALKLQEFRQKVWKRISDELGLEPCWVKLKWKNLRDTYCRILKCKNKSPKGVKRKKWLFEDQLSFLKFPYEPGYETQCVELTDEYINDINTEMIGTTQDIINQIECNDDDDYTEYLEILDEDTNSDGMPSQEISSTSNKDETLQRLAIDAYAKQIQSKFRKIRPKRAKKPKLEESLSSVTPILINKSSSVLVSDQTVLRNVQKERLVKKKTEKSTFDYEADNDSFFNSMAQIVKKLPPKTQADVKMDILKIVSEAEADNSKNHSSNMLKFSNIPGVIPKLVLVPCKIIDNQLDKT